MQIGSGRHTYEWLDNWGRTPDNASSRANGRTHGVVVSQTGQVIVFHQANPAVLVFAPDGTLASAWGDRFEGAHGLNLSTEGDTEYLWLTDQTSGEVAKMTLAGETCLQIQRPDLPVYASGSYAPTWVAVNEARAGGNDDIWVTDGYGQNYIHRYDKHGRYLLSINGTEGAAGAFKCPHGIWVDTRKGEPELYIADRGNRRVQVYDLEGQYKRVFGDDILTSPCGFATHGDELYIPELYARLAILDRNDQLIGYLGENEAVVAIDGWPNHPVELIQPGKFNSPHGLAADSAGNLYIAEWIIGGRITKLARV